MSSWDKSGGNDDYLIINSGETVRIADIRGCWLHYAHLDDYGMFGEVLSQEDSPSNVLGQ